MAIKTNFFLGCAVAMAVGCVGCDGLDDDEVADFGEGAVQARYLEWNGFNLNGFNLNGFNLNGFNLNGFNLNGFNLNGSKLCDDVDGDNVCDTGEDFVHLTEVRDPDYYKTNNVQLVGGNLKVNGSGGQGAEMSYFKYSVKQGASTVNKQIWLNYAYPTSQSDVWEYQLQLSTDGGYSWPNLCGGALDRALIVPGLWDSDTGAKTSATTGMTYACNNGAIAKCVKLGYRPWATKNTVPLADYHQACTRMIRADYCGTGGSHTVDGVRIHVLDQIGIQNMDTSANYVVEAEWGPNGAVCLNSANTRLANQTIECSIPTCGSSFASGGLIQSGKLVQ